MISRLGTCASYNVSPFMVPLSIKQSEASWWLSREIFFSKFENFCINPLTSFAEIEHQPFRVRKLWSVIAELQVYMWFSKKAKQALYRANAPNRETIPSKFACKITIGYYLLPSQRSHFMLLFVCFCCCKSSQRLVHVIYVWESYHYMKAKDK